ncbi:hypothetical protein J1N35_018473 [Gossypium stocksii]|uniref:Uncharacterized protein n=1 Tax=Gossypium stocksii TaxID=47602 RepID=A0A9D3VP41_9ROSI|nr:hypothetical protein J1N35_018473 [Gossypium stocksii]
MRLALADQRTHLKADRNPKAELKDRKKGCPIPWPLSGSDGRRHGQWAVKPRLRIPTSGIWRMKRALDTILGSNSDDRVRPSDATNAGIQVCGRSQRAEKGLFRCNPRRMCLPRSWCVPRAHMGGVVAHGSGRGTLEFQSF